jgi:hypothetical protein
MEGSLGADADALQRVHSILSGSSVSLVTESTRLLKLLICADLWPNGAGWRGQRARAAQRMPALGRPDLLEGA